MATMDERKRVTVPASIAKQLGTRFYFEMDSDGSTVRLVKAETLRDGFGILKGRNVPPFVREKDDPKRNW